MKEKITEKEMEERYDNMLDETNEEMFNILPSRILSECDPIAYNCGLSDYEDSISEDTVVKDGDYDDEEDEGVEEWRFQIWLGIVEMRLQTNLF